LLNQSIPLSTKHKKTMKTTFTLALLAMLSGSVSFAENTAGVDSVKLCLSLKAEIAKNQSFVLEIVERAVRANPECSCEIVKASIQATHADVKLVASIVEVVALSAPEQLRLAAQCAVAVAPDALEEVQLVLAKYDAAGQGSKKKKSSDDSGDGGGDDSGDGGSTEGGGEGGNTGGGEGGNTGGVDGGGSTGGGGAPSNPLDFPASSGGGGVTPSTPGPVGNGSSGVPGNQVIVILPPAVTQNNAD
jgi:hypothetical protein